jgi:hypothetical protein
MPPIQPLPARPRLIWALGRILLATFLFTLMAFAVTLLLAILGTIVLARLRGVYPNLTLAYRNVALPVAVVAGGIVFILSAVMEARNYSRTNSPGRSRGAGR